MKRLFILTTILGATLIASSAYSQVYVNAHIGFRVPGVRVYVSTPPPPTVVYQQYPAPAPAPVYQDQYNQDGYSQDGYGYAPAPTTVVYENEFPGYVYYNYPAYCGHYRDRVYYEHYRPYFERDYRPYFCGRRFDHERFEHDRYDRDRYDRGEHRGWDHDRGEHRGWYKHDRD
ncbi:MAG: hypothetical protein BGO55_27585 [Sphingobacteriales bacterium 50-39]|nr:hypothetical protein [Sphingobacteriales bacterium]OJW56808.1 MAG: hypothetical protein BGO55_27585 [Sphingobacteriales bacterium 50-39]